MNNLTRFVPLRFAFVVAGALAISAISGHAQSAVATISGVPDGANWDYTIVLQNTGSTELNTFWYGWTDDGNNLPSNPTSAANSLGWDSDLDGNSIYYTLNNSGGTLAAGDSATFTFVTASDPSDMTSDGAGASVVYDNNGESLAFSPTLIATPTPEPSSVGLFTLGSFGVAWVGWKKSRKQLVQTSAVRK